MTKRLNVIKVKEPIRLRSKNLSNGNKSLYLDFYESGRREYQFLKLYLIPGKNEANKKTLQLAEAIKAKQIVEYQNGIHGFSNTGIKSKINLIDYVKKYAEKKRNMAGGNERGTHQTYLALAYHLKQYAGEKTTFRQVDKSFCNGFLEYLKTAKSTLHHGNILAENTQFGYMKKLETIINNAIVDEIMTLNPLKLIKAENKPKKRDTEIPYLTTEEVQRLIDTECAYPNVRNAFLFACFSGLRFSDIQSMSWDKLSKDNNGETVLKYRQKKTKKYEDLPISHSALEFLPKEINNKFSNAMIDMAQ